MDSLGQYLKQGREEVGVSLEELSQRTKIRLESLQSLEKDDLDSLPTDPYVRGFVKLVCRELGLMPQDGLNRYETLRAHSGPDDEMTWAEESTRQSKGRLGRALEDPEQVVRRARRFARLAGWSAAVVTLALVVWGGTRLVGQWTGSADAGAAPGNADEELALSGAERVEPDPGPLQGTDRDGAGDTTTGSPAADPPPPSEGGGDAVAALAADTATEATDRAEPIAIDMPLEEIRVEQHAPQEVTAESILVTVSPAASEADRLAAEAAEKARADELAVEAARKAREDQLAADAADVAEQTRQDQLAADAAEQTRQDQLAADAAEQTSQDQLAADAAEKERQARVAAQAASRVVVPPPAAGDRLVLEVEALRSVQITVLLDGIGYPRTRTLDAGTRKAWKADSLFLLSADDGGALRIQLSGTDLGVPGTVGEPLDRLPIRASRP